DADCLVLKLADFGIATSFRPAHTAGGIGGAPSHEAHSDTGMGSLPYMAPELLAGAPPATSGDMWACGVVIYVMLSGDLPFGDDPEVLCSICEPPDFSGAAWDEVSSEAVGLIKKLVNIDTPARWTAKQALQHEWIPGSSSGSPQ
ncbi:unnamed protein product, partial [Prorocentrum cordatum]